ncbi:MAG TPA: DUF6531 domain-containing protein [Parachlamydiaceae bacterium]|nr:DUF6531 domain-containing protein [Parachlamydiaceae bacterium]
MGLSGEQLPYFTSENDALSLVEGIVNVYNGKLVQKNSDVQILGSKPFEINRYYDSGHHFKSHLGYGVGLSTPLLLKFNKKGKKRNLTFEQRTGFAISCTVKKVFGKKEKSYYKGTVDKKFFKSGYTNCSEALLNGEPSTTSFLPLQ